MVCKSSSLSQRPAFALAAILMVVVLAAALVAGVSAGLQNSFGFRQKQTDVADAAGVVNQAQALSNAILTLKSKGTLIGDIVMDDDDPTCDGSARVCLFNPQQGGIHRPRIAERWLNPKLQARDGWQLQPGLIYQDQPTPEHTIHTGFVVTLENLTRDVCRAINAQVVPASVLNLPPERPFKNDIPTGEVLIDDESLNVELNLQGEFSMPAACVRSNNLYLFYMLIE